MQKIRSEGECLVVRDGLDVLTLTPDRGTIVLNRRSSGVDPSNKPSQLPIMGRDNMRDFADWLVSQEAGSAEPSYSADLQTIAVNQYEHAACISASQPSAEELQPVEIEEIEGIEDDPYVGALLDLANDAISRGQELLRTLDEAYSSKLAEYATQLAFDVPEGLQPILVAQQKHDILLLNVDHFNTTRIPLEAANGLGRWSLSGLVEIPKKSSAWSRL